MSLRSAVFAVLAFALGACAARVPADGAAKDEDFARALSVCRFQHTGATNQKLALPATEEHIGRCLESRGWRPTGERVYPDTGAT